MNLSIYDISVIPLIIFLTRVAVSIGLPKKYSPLVSIALGIPLGVFYFSPGNIFKGIVIGIFIASSSVGFYSGSKNVYQEYHSRKLAKKENRKTINGGK